MKFMVRHENRSGLFWAGEPVARGLFGVAGLGVFARLLICAGALVGGCKAEGVGGASGRTEPTHRVKGEPLPVRQAPRAGAQLIKSGAAPMRHMLAAGGQIVINDITQDTELVRAAAAPGTLITIDRQSGIRIGNEIAVAGPLPSGHRYEIYVNKHNP